MKSWSEYFELSKNLPPKPLLESAVRLVVNRGHALDLGAGSLRDSKFLLSIGFQKVVAVDQSAGIKKYRSKIPANQLQIRISAFEKLKIKPRSFDLITAQYSLPFTSPPHLPALLEQIKKGLRPSGLFCGQFFGPRDSWNSQPDMTFINKTSLRKLLAPLDILYFREEEKDAKTIDGQLKHWHLFQVIALQPPPRKRKKISK